MSEAFETLFGLPRYAVERLREVFAEWPGIDRVLIYGSRAKGTHRYASDIDLCIEGPDLTVVDLLRLENAIDDLLLPWRVDLALRHTIDDPALTAHIDRVGCVFYEGWTAGNGPSPNR